MKQLFQERVAKFSPETPEESLERFFCDFRFPFGTLLGYFGGSKWLFLDTFLEVSQKDATLVSFWTILGGFGEHFRTIWARVGRI